MRDKPSDKQIYNGIRSFDVAITKEFFYGYCRRAYSVFDHKYQLSNKAGLDFYSLAHDYYIQLLTHDFQQLKDCPKSTKLSTWMTGGFRFVILEALKAFNKECDNHPASQSDVILEYLRDSDHETGLLHQVIEAVNAHYNDPKMTTIARMVLLEGFIQKDAAIQLGLTPSAVNQRYKKMMDEVITPFVIENYSSGIYYGTTPTECICEEAAMPMEVEYSRTFTPFGRSKCCSSINTPMYNNRITPDYISTLKANEIFVFGSNLQGMHGGGAARAALLHFGAVLGQGVGLQGQSYAIPTMQGGPETIKPYVDDFIVFAKQHPESTFLVTPIGCGIAGFEPDDIAPLFKDACYVENISLPQSFWDILH